MTVRRTRLAPSPTGALHLGNARTFLITWALARSLGWEIVLRIEDLDTPRTRPGADQQAIDDLRWLGLDWDMGPLVQSADLRPYHSAMHALASAGRAYPCELTRSQIELAASAPQEGAHDVRFPADLRPAPIRPSPFDAEAATNWRFAVDAGDVVFEDALAGPQRQRPADDIGDFVIWTRRKQPAYQLAVIVDDHRQGVSDVVRGDDLLPSASRQMLLYEALGLGPTPRWWHLPLVVGTDGRRLAKRHGDTRLSFYRERGVPAERVIGLVASWSGVLARHHPQDMDARTFLQRFDPHTIPPQAITHLPEDERWLHSGSVGAST